MNNNRRKQIRAVAENITQQLAKLQLLQEEEQESFENLPDNLFFSEKGEKMETCAEELQSVHDEIESQLEQIEDIIQ